MVYQYKYLLNDIQLNSISAFHLMYNTSPVADPTQPVNHIHAVIHTVYKMCGNAMRLACMDMHIIKYKGWSTVIITLQL